MGWSSGAALLVFTFCRVLWLGCDAVIGVGLCSVAGPFGVICCGVSLPYGMFLSDVLGLVFCLGARGPTAGGAVGARRLDAWELRGVGGAARDRRGDVGVGMRSTSCLLEWWRGAGAAWAHRRWAGAGGLAGVGVGAWGGGQGVCGGGVPRGVVGPDGLGWRRGRLGEGAAGGWGQAGGQTRSGGGQAAVGRGARGVGVRGGGPIASCVLVVALVPRVVGLWRASRYLLAAPRDTPLYQKF